MLSVEVLYQDTKCHNNVTAFSANYIMMQVAYLSFPAVENV